MSDLAFTSSEVRVATAVLASIFAVALVVFCILPDATEEKHNSET